MRFKTYEDLKVYEDKLITLGYVKYSQHLRNEDYSYNKVFDEKYQIVILIYDFIKYDKEYGTIGISYECITSDLNGRIDLSVSSDDISIEKFEEMSLEFYNTMKKYVNI